MSCTGEKKEQSEVLAQASRIAGSQVDGAAHCLHPGCNQPLNAAQECSRGHSQHPADVVQALIAGCQKWRSEELQRLYAREWGQGDTAYGWSIAEARVKAALAWSAAQELDGNGDLAAQAQNEVACLERMDRMQAVHAAHALLDECQASPQFDAVDRLVLGQLARYYTDAPPADPAPILRRAHTRLQGFRDSPEGPAPHPVACELLRQRLAELETYDETRARLTRQYPHQFPSEDRILAHLFFQPTGGGMDWENGQLVMSWPTPDDELEERRQHHGIWHPGQLPTDPRLTDLPAYDPAAPPPLLRAPVDVTSDWRGAALRAIELARRFGWANEETLAAAEWRLWHQGQEKPQSAIPQRGVWADEDDSKPGKVAQDWQRLLQREHEQSGDCWDSECDTYGQVQVRVVRGQDGITFEGHCTRCGFIEECDYDPDPDREARVRY